MLHPKPQPTPEIQHMRKSVLKVLVGFSCLPTTTKYHPLQPTRSNAFAPNQIQYILESTDETDLKGGPARVVLTSFEPLADGDDLFEVGDAIVTKHFSEKKQLPSRRIVSIITPDGSVHGAPVPVGTSLPHWELMGEVTLETVVARIETNRAGKVVPKQLTLGV